jgi:hypothetical protein
VHGLVSVLPQHSDYVTFKNSQAYIQPFKDPELMFGHHLIARKSGPEVKLIDKKSPGFDSHLFDAHLFAANPKLKR